MTEFTEFVAPYVPKLDLEKVKLRKRTLKKSLFVSFYVHKQEIISYFIPFKRGLVEYHGNAKA